MSYKGLPFETVWVEYPDIATEMKKVAASPNKRPDGSEIYTLPVVSDPNTGAIITDSFAIAEYLEKTYPEKPLFPNNTQALTQAFDSAYVGLTQPTVQFILLRVAEVLNEPSAKYFTETREIAFGRIQDWSPEGPTRDAHWAVHEEGYGTTRTWYEKSGGRWIMGDTFSYADIIVTCRLLWLKRVLYEDEWKKVCSWHNGRWEKLLADVEKECNFA